MDYISKVTIKELMLKTVTKKLALINGMTKKLNRKLRNSS